MQCMVLEQKCVLSVLCGINIESTLKRIMLTSFLHHFGVLSDKACSNLRTLFDGIFKNLERKTCYESSRFTLHVMHYARKPTNSLHRIGYYPYRRPRELFVYSRYCEGSTYLRVTSKHGQTL
jgi:hypothetical protein